MSVCGLPPLRCVAPYARAACLVARAHAWLFAFSRLFFALCVCYYEYYGTHSTTYYTAVLSSRLPAYMTVGMKSARTALPMRRLLAALAHLITGTAAPTTAASEMRRA